MADQGVLSHPEILPLEKLVDILSSRGIPTKELVEKDKNDLVQLFYRFVVPLPQRKSNMRRANRLRNKLSPNINNIVVKVKPADLDDEERGCNRGLKRKNESSDMVKTTETQEVSNFLHKSSQPSSICSPTTECTNKITKLNMNCAVKTTSKPLKLNRTLTLHDSKQKDSDFTKLKTLNIEKQSETPETRIQECSQTSNKDFSESNTEESTENTPKKFKRIPVTWP